MANSRYTDLRQLCRDAIAIQDACNPSGVAYALTDAYTFLRTLKECSGTDWLKTQACAVLIAHKLADLHGVADIGSGRYSEAYRLCKEGAE